MKLNDAIEQILSCNKAGLNVIAIPRGSDGKYGICLNKTKTGIVGFDYKDSENHALPIAFDIDWTIVSLPFPEVRQKFTGHNEDRRYQTDIEDWLAEQFKKLDLSWDSGIDIEISIKTVRRERD
jgi:hypothetical protein